MLLYMNILTYATVASKLRHKSWRDRSHSCGMNSIEGNCVSKAKIEALRTEPIYPLVSMASPGHVKELAHKAQPAKGGE